jgi:hypothetical protein
MKGNCMLLVAVPPAAPSVKSRASARLTFGSRRHCAQVQGEILLADPVLLLQALLRFLEGVDRYGRSVFYQIFPELNCLFDRRLRDTI